ncbi:hypothetical protein [Halosimplex sp. TS25]|uniref:hypothetical protein n=1 Tax=Halosimplex rarum TaxID=3396619 RepID=UPI0039E7E82F
MPGSLLTSARGEICIVLGFALLLNPFVVGAFDVGDPDSYTYEPKEVTFYDNGTYDAADGADVVDPRVACLDDTLPTRSCAVERAVHATGGVTYDGPPSNFLDHDYWYVHVWGEGFFEPVAEELENGTVEYGLEPVPRSEALEAVSTQIDDASNGVREAIETGEYRTSDPLDGADELVVHDGSYYVVTATSYRATGSERRGVVVFLQWALGAGGAWLVLRGQRLRVTGARFQ